jgi:hypothetical protein
MTERHHLRVIQDGSAPGRHSRPAVAGTPASTQDALPERSRGTWFALSTLVAVALWLPLGMLGLWSSRWGALGIERLGRALGAAAIRTPTGIALLPILAAFAVAAFAGGVVYAKFGRSLRATQDALVGAVAGAIVTSLAAVEGALRPWQLGVAAYVTLVVIGAASAYFGGRLGRSSRDAANLGRLRPSPEEH